VINNLLGRFAIWRAHWARRIRLSKRHERRCRRAAESRVNPRRFNCAFRASDGKSSTALVRCRISIRRMSGWGVKVGLFRDARSMSGLPPECMDPPCVARENGEPGVRSCTNVTGLALELVLRTIMEIRAHPILLATMPLRAIFGGQFSDAPGRPILHLFSFSRRPRWGNDCGLTCRFWQS
jgi:hypothetical protein